MEKTMKTSSNTAAKLAGITSLAILLTTSAFADSRPQNQTDWRDGNRDRGRSESRSGYDNYRENDRVNLQGRITAFNRESNGYRVNLDRGNTSFFVPEEYFRNRARDLRVGVSISLGGIFRRGSVYVDAVSWPDDGYGYGGYDRGYDRSYGGHLFGVVDRIDFRRDTVWLREDRGGRITEVDMRSNDRYSRLDIDDLRRGDFIELSGNWVRGGVFIADRIDSVRSGHHGRY